MNAVNCLLENSLAKTYDSVSAHSKKLTEIFEMVEDAACDLALYCPEDQHLQHKLESFAEDILRSQNELKIKANIINLIKEEGNSFFSEGIEGPVQKLDLLVKYGTLVKQKVKKNVDVSKYEKMEELNPGQYYEDSQGNKDDDDVQMEARVETFKCPVSMQQFVDPVYSTLCHHTYSDNSIKNLLRHQSQVKCPVAACNQYVSQNLLKPDNAMVRRMNRQKYLDLLNPKQNNFSVVEEEEEE